METVEYAILAGLVVAGLVALIVTMGLWVRKQYRRLGGQLDWDPGPGYSGEG